MPELRKDPILGRWVIIAGERAKRHKDFAHAPAALPEGVCPFCAGKEHLTAGEIFSLKDEAGNWKLRVVPSISPFMEAGRDFWKKGRGPYDLRSASGSHEVVIETPKHVANMADLSDREIKDVMTVYRGRMLELKETAYLKSVLVFKNYGRCAGASLNHSCSQLIATPVNFKRVKEELEGAKFYYETHERCVFCDIVKQELDSNTRIVLDEQGFTAFVPFAPRFPFEVWIVPRKHGADFYKSDDAALDGLAGLLKKLLSKIKAALGDPAYNYVIHTAPFRRPQAGYWSTIEEDFHWHMEIIPHLNQPAGFEWGTGFYICPALPEEAAKLLRET